MARSNSLVRKSFFIDERELRRAKRVLGADSDAEAVRLSLERIGEMEKFWQWMDKSCATLEPKDFGEV